MSIVLGCCVLKQLNSIFGGLFISFYFQFDLLGLVLSLKEKNFQKKTILDNFEVAGENVVPP